MLKMPSKKKSAFTLIEMLIVVAIVGLMFGVGIAQFFNYRDRQTLEQTAANLQSFINQAKNYAKTGYRGTASPCGIQNTAQGNLSIKLQSWQITYDKASRTFTSFPTCTKKNSPEQPDSQDIPQEPNYNASLKFILPEAFTAEVTTFTPTIGSNNAIINFNSVFGNAQIAGDSNKLKIVLKDAKGGDDGIAYQFFVSTGGIISDGCLCVTDNCAGDNEC